VPHGFSLDEALQLRQQDPKEYVKRSMNSIAAHVQAMLDLQKKGAVTFD
jgi:urocanate hydratase